MLPASIFNSAQVGPSLAPVHIEPAAGMTEQAAYLALPGEAKEAKENDLGPLKKQMSLPATDSGAIWKAVLEVSPCFFLAGMGMVASGALLEYTTGNMKVFRDVPALIILVPALLGLKGNLEMTLGARLGSHANKNELEGETFWPIVNSNLMAIQGQAIVVGTVASMLAAFENYITSGWSPAEVLLLASSSITAASIASLVLSCLMIAIVVAASRRGVDPDNITAPIAGTLGDFCTLSIVVLVAKLFWALPESLFFTAIPCLLCVYPFVAAFCCMGAYRSKYSHEIMKYGWYPILVSMLLSNLSGPISQASIQKFKNFALFQVGGGGGGGLLPTLEFLPFSILVFVIALWAGVITIYKESCRVILFGGSFSKVPASEKPAPPPPPPPSPRRW